MNEKQALTRVKRAYNSRRRAEEAIREAVLAARDLGISYPRIAAAAGVSHPAVMELESRARASRPSRRRKPL